jgi:hypothetical protein
MAIGYITPNAELVLGYQRGEHQGAGNEGLAGKDQAPPSRHPDRLYFVRHRQTGFPKRTIARGKFCAANSVALNRVFFERSPIGCSD